MAGDARKDDELARLRREIDAIDDSLHDLLMRRTELAVRIGAVKAKAQPVAGSSPAEGAKFIRPAREAQILRRLVARHRGSLPKAALIHMWREMISALLQVEGPFAVAVYAPTDHPGYWDMARDHYGKRVPILPFAETGAILNALGEGRATVGILPYPSAAAPLWWPDLLAWPEIRRPHVIARLPFGDPGNQRESRLSALVLGHAASEPSGRDRTLIAIDRAVWRARRSAIAGGRGVPIHEQGESVLVEIPGFLSPGESAREGALWLGAYAEPLTPAELDGMTGDRNPSH